MLKIIKHQEPLPILQKCLEARERGASAAFMDPQALSNRRQDKLGRSDA
jgi:hypothetical protein